MWNLRSGHQLARIVITDSTSNSYVSLVTVFHPLFSTKLEFHQAPLSFPLRQSISRFISAFIVTCHQYADDTQLYTSIDLSSDDDINNLSNCANAVTRWHLENNLLLNPSKNEALVTGTKQQVKKFDNAPSECQEIRLAVAEATVPCSVAAVRILSVKSISIRRLTITSWTLCLAVHHIRSLRHIGRLIDKDTAATLRMLNRLDSTRLDYCNAVLYGITSKKSNRLQRVHNSLTRDVCNTPYRSPSSHFRKALHWLPVEQRIKIAVMKYELRTHQQPSYLHEYINDYVPVRTLRSVDRALLRVSSTKTATAARAFRVAATNTPEQSTHRSQNFYVSILIMLSAEKTFV